MYDHRFFMCVLTAMVTACGHDEPRDGPRPPGAPDVQHADSGDAEHADSGDAQHADSGGVQHADTASAAQFWRPLEIDGDWAEFHPDLRALVTASELVALGEVERVTAGPTLQGDAAEDVVVHAALSIRLLEVMRGEAGAQKIELRQILPTVSDEAELQTTIAQMNSALPLGGPIVVMLRRRTDTGGWVVVNGYGLWAETLRVEVDAPLNPEPPHDGVYGPELDALDDFEQFVAAIREYASAR